MHRKVFCPCKVFDKSSYLTQGRLNWRDRGAIASPPTRFMVGIKAKPSPLKGLGLLFTPQDFRPSYGSLTYVPFYRKNKSDK